MAWFPVNVQPSIVIVVSTAATEPPCQAAVPPVKTESVSVTAPSE